MSATLESHDVDRIGFARPSTATLMARPRLMQLALCLPGVLALIIWRLSLRHVDVENLGSYGLPPALPLAWYLALALSVLGAVTAAAARRSSGLIIFGYVTVVVVILYGTVPVLSGQPHYAWVYKHIGVVRYLEAHGQVNLNVDIYNRWPGFFALGAMFSRLVGRTDPETYASWAELVFVLLDGALVMTVVKAVAREVRIAGGAALFFILTNWVGQTYYSPQALTFALGLALTAVVLRHLTVDGARFSQRLTRLIERVGRVPQLAVHKDATVKWPRWAAITIVLSLDAMIVASHQLTPYVLLVSTALLMLAGVIRPSWMLGAMAAITLSYLAANFSYIQHHFGFFTSLDPFNNVQRVRAYNQAPSAGKTFNTHAELLAILVLLAGGLCASVRLLRRGLLASIRHQGELLLGFG